MWPIERLTDRWPELVLLTSWGDELDVVCEEQIEETKKEDSLQVQTNSSTVVRE